MPGHGPVSDKEAVNKTLKYLRLFKRASRLGFNRRTSVEEVSRAIRLGGFADWVEPERIMINVHRLFEEFRGELPNARAIGFV